MDIQRKAFQEWYIANHHDGDIHPNQQLLEWSEKGGFYFASSVEDLWEAWQAAKAQAVPDQLDVNSILHDIDCYFDSGLSNTERTANNLIQSIYEKLSGEIKAQEPTND